MIEYPKIETLYDRDPDNMKRVLVGEYRDPAFALVDRWLVTEKVDGTNVRVMLDGATGSVKFGGRTDDAQMPMHLLDRLNELLPQHKVAAAFDLATEAIIFGEGYGPKIQKGGGDYADKPGFIMFDVAVITVDKKVWWLNWDDVEDVARKLGVPTVPVIGRNVSTETCLTLVKSGSLVAADGTGAVRDQEGIVCRTDPLLFMRNGHRLVWKLKGRDLA